VFSFGWVFERGNRWLRTPKLRGPCSRVGVVILKAPLGSRRSREKESPPRGGAARCPRWRGLGLARACSSGTQSRPAGSDTPVSAESAARCDLRVVAPGRGVGSAGDFGPWDCSSCAPCARVYRPLGWSAGSAYRAFPSGESWWVRGSEAKQVNSGGANECEYRPRGRGNPAQRERTRWGSKASRRTEPAVRAITASATQGDREIGFGWSKGSS